ncbi:hypothetical protein FP744_10003337 [Trichoderma asperellum]
MAHYPIPFIRVITTHDPESGNAIFEKNLENNVQFEGFPVPTGNPPTSDYALEYSTTTFPVQGLSPESSDSSEFRANLDIKQYKASLQNISPLNPAGGTACTVVEVPYGNDIAMHRTVSLDFGVIIDGTAELVLDSGEKKILKKGDVKDGVKEIVEETRFRSTTGRSYQSNLAEKLAPIQEWTIRSQPSRIYSPRVGLDRTRLLGGMGVQWTTGGFDRIGSVVNNEWAVRTLRQNGLNKQLSAVILVTELETRSIEARLSTGM